ncbi:TrmB family transcriptional regulator [Haloarcula sp. CBA1130]|uniref:TrmB family transcriptional regulator n=1 Tax=unclassified Haloarcula TaxID=2624677 RepID=UPI001249438D|nr:MULTISPECIES: TrmB family transcriptional regulator [unclassified Haloarcula]KAA9397778.1 TrmB family transcriptional regulator [Haloarcula sp. CBA1129]KAA9402535.1 TrmB family transcriptional regulator [Haloarcula sp. CBA1130]
MDDSELTDVLEDAGLSPYQAEAYVALLGLGTASATDIADSCDVPDPRIYDVLRDLETKGYIETFQQDSLTARARNPDVVLEDLRSRSSKYLDAAETIEERWNQPEISDHEVSIVKRFETVVSRARELIEAAENQIQVGVDPEQFYAVREELIAAHDRGVDIKLSICTGPDEDVPPMADIEGTCTEARNRDIPAPFFVLVDRTWTCFAPHHDSVNEYGVLVKDRTHTYVFHWFFLTCLWEIWDTLYTERTPETPTTYVDLRHAVRDIEPLLNEEATIEAVVRGYDTETKESVELTGRITAVDYTGSSIGRTDPVPLAQLAGRISATIVTDDGTYEIGGWGAVIEEIEATEITITNVQYE